MYCPEHLVCSVKYLQIWHHQRADIPREYVSWGEVLNPLRYEICVGPGPGRFWHINNDAALWLKWRNFIYRLRKIFEATQ